MITRGIGLGLAFWVIDSIVDHIFFNKSGLIAEIFYPSSYELYVRSLVLVVLVLVSYQAQISINKSKQMEKEVQQSEENYRTMIENCNDLIWTLDTQGSFTFINQRTEEVAGYKPADLLGKNFAPVIPLADLPRIQQIYLATLNGKAQQNKISFYGANGSLISLSINTAPIYKSNEIIGTVCFGRNITEQKQAEEALQESEERYRHLVELSPDAILVYHDDHIIFSNQALAKLLKIESSKELVGKPIRDFIDQYVYAQFRPMAQERMLLVLKKQKAPLSEEKYVQTDGGIIDVEVIASAFNLHGKITTQVVIRDISERKIMERELLKADKLEAIGILAGGIAHDFNNALAIVLGNVSLAELYVEAGKYHEALGKLAGVEKAVNQAKGLTAQLLTFAKGGVPVKKVVSLGKLIKDTASFALSGSNVLCNFVCPDDLWSVELDAGQISQVISNLMINAAQSMPDGGSIKFEIANLAIGDESVLPLTAGKYIKIAIMDQGIGIPQRYLQKIFDPYFTTKQKGSGLGLTTSYAIIKQHGGYITVDSNVGVGTCFHVYLPALAAAEEPEAHRKGTYFCGNGKILLMDDEKIIREVVGEMLNYLGYQVDLVKNGTEVIELYRRARESGQRYDVLIMDLTVPGEMGGREAIAIIRETDPGVKAIVASGYAIDQVIASYRQHGFSGVVTKPYELFELSRVVYEVINGVKTV